MANDERRLPAPQPAEQAGSAQPAEQVGSAQPAEQADPTLRFERSRHPSGAPVLHVVGAVDDATAADLRVELGVWSDEDPDLDVDLVVDLSGVQFLGTAGLTALLEARDMVAAEGGRLRVLCGRSRPARRALQVTGAMNLVEVLDRVPGKPVASRDVLFGVPGPDVRLDGQTRRNEG